MAAVGTPSLVDNRSQFSAGSKYWVFGTITVSASPATYTTGGIVTNLETSSEIKASRTPLAVFVWGVSGYVYAYIPGSNNSNGLLKIFVQGAAAGDPLAEIGNGDDIPAGVSGDTINFIAVYYGME